MKLKQSIVEQLGEPVKRSLIGIELGVGEPAIAVQVRKNKENGPLTKMNALMAISKIIGVSIEELLEASEVIGQ